ncbi:MAG: glycosyltransferase family 39 protein [Firmicutes bacterium]|nr:glycosyltransferase family 39 protein [Bacillota bacterium]
MENSIDTINTIFSILVWVMVAYSIFKYASRRLESRKIPSANSGKQMLAKGSARSFELNPRTYYIILAVIAVIGITMRVWKFGSVPGGFNQDGAMAAVDGKALADYGTDRLGTWLPAHLYAWGDAQMSSLLSYMIAVFVKLFGLSAITARLPQLTASIAGGVFFYLFIKDVFGKNAALIAAVFVALNPWHLVQSRWALDCNLLPHFFMAGVYFLNHGLSGKKRYIYISMIFFALCMYCYGITIYTIPIFLLGACVYYLVKKKITWKTALISLAIYLAISWPFLLTMAVNFFKWDTIELPFVTIQYFKDSVRSSDILFFSNEPLKQLLSNFKCLMNTTVLQKKDLPWNDIEGFGTMFLCSMPFMIAGAVEIFAERRESDKSLVVFALLAGVLAGLFTNNVNVNRVNLVYYGVMMFIAAGIYFVIKEIKYAEWVNLGIYAVLGAMLVSTYFGSYADSMNNYFHAGFGEAVEAAEDSGAEKIYIAIEAEGDGYVRMREILTMFYDKTDAEYFQGKKNENNGEELLPYNERFSYVLIDDSLTAETKDEDAAYVIASSDEKYFDSEEFDIERFGNYSAAVKK